MQQTKKRSIIPDNAQKKGCVPAGPVCVIQIPPGGMPARQICSEYYTMDTASIILKMGYLKKSFGSR